MIGEKIKALRKEKGITIAEAAKIFSVAPRTYSSYEAEEREPNIEMINKLADFYGVTTDYLLGREPAPDPLAGIHFKTVDNDEFVRLYSELPEQVKQIFVDTMAKLAQAQEQEKKKHSVRTGDLIDDEQAEETDAI